MQHEMEEAFPFVETPDQHRAILDIKADMERAFPMDRLVCGDVGFGKTEIAIRHSAELRHASDRYELLRAGEPYQVRGAGGVDHLERLVAVGAISLRTWGTEQTEAVLDTAGRLGLTVCAGLCYGPLPHQ